ncbi:DNA starvation/stationary phase protection protein [Marinobacterium sp. AK62]|uniref:DNA starvation/stationary phase protection protein n=1 Tax=Marinobacterium alkalitolerans TaxID=1542925 RepID=A0ABS3ZES3_9GAMM|nr:Dps family protein [Marinobacterium alkalitolerans]MBP0050186.1 DNA starvation/stationary phase protection protein [Marinobacterium alkalitolerans]
MQTNRIGLDTEKSTHLAKRLNELLASYQIFYMNVRSYHWNVRGPEFFELHVKFEEQYNDLLLKVDEIAERILTLGQPPMHAFSAYLETSTIQEAHNVTEGKACVRGLLDGYKTLIEMQREIMELAGEASDEGTATLMSDYITQQEKTVWMFSAWMG